MNRKHIRQMNTSLLRRLTTRPAVYWMEPYRDILSALLEEQNYIQRFAPLFNGSRLRCADVLALCREDLCRLAPEPEEGWLLFTYDFARGTMFPDPANEERHSRHGAGAVFFLSLLQVLLDAERARLPAAYLLAHWFGQNELYWSYPFGWILGLAITLPVYFRKKWLQAPAVSQNQPA